MLMWKVDGQWSPWNGEVIDNTVYPLNIESLWSSDQLSKIGLYIPAELGVPDDKIATGWNIEDVDGLPVRTPTLIDKPKPTPSFEERLSAVEAKLGIS